MKKALTVAIIIVLAFALVACSEAGESLNAALNAADKSSGREGAPASEGGFYEGSGGAYYDEGASASYKSSVGEPEGAPDAYETYAKEDGAVKNGEERLQAGQITAKAWNDNENYSAWKKLFSEETANDPAGKFVGYKTGDAARDTLNRVKITVTQGEKKVFGAKVAYFDAAQKDCAARTDVNGVAYLFPSEERGTITVSSGGAQSTATFTKEDRDLTVDLAASEGKVNSIKIMFVIDATGSMGDEMRYLTAELADVVERVTRKAEQVKIDLALLFYRDEGDEEKFAYSDFKTVSEKQEMEKQIGVLSKQRAEGGGDSPEALDEALELAAGKDWGEENATRLMFIVLDAPPHSDKATLARYAAAVDTAAAKGIAICPVLCSGADTLCEFVTRTSALLTGGTSIFVTDDSGIGGSHLDPELPDAVVERLNDLLVRLIVGYHTGDFGEAKAWKGNSQQTQEPTVSDLPATDDAASDGGAPTTPEETGTAKSAA